MIRRPPPADLVIDTSAVMAILQTEATADRVASSLREAEGPVISAGTLTELSIVTAARLGPAGIELLQVLLDAADVVTTPVDGRIADLALEAWQRYGKGNHPAGLNLGDCFAYATAAHYEVPLLCVGNDFAKTDLALIDVSSV